MDAFLRLVGVAYQLELRGTTYEQLRSRGVEFPQPPEEQPFGWWSMFEDLEGNRFALSPRE